MVDIWHFLGSNRVLYLLWNAAVPDLPMDDPLKFVNQSLTIFWLTFIKHIVEKAKESRPTGIYYCTIIADNTSGVFPTPRLSNLGLDA